MYEKFQFDLARNSLRYLIQKFQIKEIYIPYYLCDVIRHTIFEEHCKPIFYHIDDNFYPAQDFSKDSYVIYPNYFGVCDENVNKLENIYTKLIVDNAHAYYLPPQGFACFNAEHKFKPYVMRSYLYIKNININDFSLACCPKKRIDEFNRLHAKYKNINKLKILPPKSPFVYPLLLSTDAEADNIANELMTEGKTIYRYWNSLPKSYNEYKFYRRLIPIPLENNMQPA